MNKIKIIHFKNRFVKESQKKAFLQSIKKAREEYKKRDLFSHDEAFGEILRTD